MAARFVEAGRVLLVRWVEPSVDDLSDVRDRLRALGERLGRKPVYIAITPADSTPPSDAVRKEMMSTMGETSELTESLHLVIEGSGFKFSALRSIVASMFLVGGNRKTFVHDKLEAAIAKAALDAIEAGLVRDAVSAMTR